MKFAFLFDNDGVLIDSHELHWEAWQRLMKEESDLHFTSEQFVKTFGKRNDLILKEVASHVPKETHEKWAQKKEAFFREIAKERITLIPGIESFLKEVQEANIPHIIASSTPTENLKLFLSSTVLGKYFDQFLSADEVARGKPHPDVFIAAAKKLGFRSKDTIVLEDAPSGIDAGKRAGAFVIALCTTHTEEELQDDDYDLIYKSPEELNLAKITERYLKWKTSWQGNGWRGLLRRIFGFFLIVVGVISFVIPVSPGLLLVFLGVLLLNARWINHHLKRIPICRKWMRKARAKKRDLEK